MELFVVVLPQGKIYAVELIQHNHNDTLIWCSDLSSYLAIWLYMLLYKFHNYGMLQYVDAHNISVYFMSTPLIID